ncbi:hypothetical protein V8E54_011403 [Elaphomyces granulatus]
MVPIENLPWTLIRWRKPENVGRHRSRRRKYKMERFIDKRLRRDITEDLDVIFDDWDDFEAQIRAWNCPVRLCSLLTFLLILFNFLLLAVDPIRITGIELYCTFNLDRVPLNFASELPRRGYDWTPLNNAVGQLAKVIWEVGGFRFKLRTHWDRLKSIYICCQDISHAVDSVAEGDDRRVKEDEAKQDDKPADEDSDFDPDEGGLDISMGSDTSARPAPRQPRRRRGRPSSPGRDWSQLVMTSAHRGCVDFCICLLKQKVIRLCANVRDGGVGGPLGREVEGNGHVLPLLSALIKIARFLVVHRATEIVMERLKMQRNRGRRHSSHGQIGCPEVVRRLMDDFMVRGTDGPMQRMVHLRRRKARPSSNGAPSLEQQIIMCHRHHTLYVDLHLSSDVIAFIQERTASSTPAEIYRELQISRPARWEVRSDTQIPLIICSRNAQVSPLIDANVRALAFYISDSINTLTWDSRGLAMDSTFGTNNGGLSLFSVLAEGDGTGAPLAYCFVEIFKNNSKA